jgi:class 3 adenylate cyclase/tetratricopeptide (TPR) repeat protein
MPCPSCASIVPEGARFCPSCGHSLATTEERRIVTVVFADLVGFSGIAQHQDPEQTKRLIDNCFERLVADVHDYGGSVDKILGDGILALFGAPIAHEDDAERAVRAALKMIDTVHEYAHTSDLELRVGVNTGEVLVGTLAGTDYTAMGDVVNLAQRLQSAAQPGEVLVGDSTYQLTAAVIEYEPAREVLAKGREQTVTAWHAVGATAPPGTRRRHRHDVCLIGRDTELQLAAAALHLAVNDHQGVLLSITGDSGVGKSRLVDELVDAVRVAGDAAVLEGSCVPYGEANVWWPIAIALSNYLGVEPGISADFVREMARGKAAALGLPAGDVEMMVEVFIHLLGQPSAIDRLEPPAARMAVHGAVTGVLMHRTQVRPIVLVIDDLHWADPLLLDLLAHCTRALARHPFALVTSMRAGHDVDWPPVGDRTTLVGLHLQPLSPSATDELATALLDEAPDATLLEALRVRSGGNPLFLIELAALTGVGAAGGNLPDSLRALIAARLDQLSPEQRQVLDNAATLGTSGVVAGLEKFAQGMGQTFDRAILAELDDAGLLEVRGARWRFRSDSVREATYQTITKASRALRHAGVATAMAGTAAIDELAHHAATAAELVGELGPVRGVPSTITAQAVDLLVQAATRAHDSGSLRQAVRHASRALALMPPDDPRRKELLLLRAASLTEQRNVAAAHLDLDAVLTLASESGDLAMEGESRRLRGSLFHQMGNLDGARVELGLAVDLLRRAERPDLLASALRTRGFIELFGGSLHDAGWFLGEAEPIFESLGDQRGLAWIEQHRAWLGFLSGDMAAARERLTHAANTLGALGDRNGVGWAFGLLAFVEFFERHFDEAERLADTVQREAEQRGDEWAAGMMQVLRADLRLWQGRLDDAHRMAEQARTTFRRIGDRFGLAQSLAPLVRSEVAMGRSAAAQRSLEELVTLGESSDQGPFPFMAAAGAAMHRGDGQFAVQMARRATHEAEQRGGGSFEPRVVEAIGLMQSGRADEALTLVEPVEPHPFAQSAAALAYALSGAAEPAIAQAERVAAADGASYLDQVVAYVAAGSASARIGEPDRAALWFEAATARALGVGDVVAIALATRTAHAVLGNTHPAHDPQAQLGLGWETVVAGLVP